MSESIIIWAITGLFAAAVILPYALRSIGKQRTNLADKQEAVSLGIDKPKAQFPLIDDVACIGCGSCIRACPEGGVLGLVGGKATIINGFRCVGHGLCAEACPVEALTIGLGDMKSRPDIPILDQDFETTVPGLYVVGELGGLALIKNAISQGTACVEAIRLDAKPHGDLDYDLMIVGAGPAGLSAGLMAAQLGINYLVIDQQEPGGTILQYPRKKLVLTQPVEIPGYIRLDKPEYEKEELLEIWQSAIDHNQLNIRTGLQLVAIQPREHGFDISTKTEEFSARRVILALGRRGSPRKLGVPGEELPKVMYQLIDAVQYRNNHLLVVGGGDSAVEAAMGLAKQPGNTVTISYRKTKFFRIKKRNDERLTQMLEAGSIRAVFDSGIKEIGPNFVEVEQNGVIEQLRNDYVFVFAGGVPPFKLLQDMGIAFGGEKRDLAVTT